MAYQIHPGSWTIPGTNFRLPDFSISEAAQRILLPQAPTTYQGGSSWGVSTGAQPFEASKFVNPTAEQIRQSRQTQTNTGPSSWGTGGTGGGTVPQTTPNIGPSQQVSGPSVNDLENQIRAEAERSYQEGMGIYNQAESNIQNQLATGLAGLSTQSEQQQRGLSSAYEQAMQQAGTQLATNEQVRQRTKNEQLRAYQQATQRGQSLFGGGSSTGGAYGEIVSQEMLRGLGSIDERYQNSLSQINQYEQGAMKTWNASKQKLTEDTAQLDREMRQEAANKVFEINQNRQMLGSQKAGLLMNLLNQNLANARALANYEFQTQKQLEVWYQQQKVLQGQAKTLANSLYQQLSQQTTQNTQSMNQVPQTTALNYTPTFSSQQMQAYRPLKNQNQEEQNINQLLNPYIA